MLQARGEIDAIGPEVDVAPGGEMALLPVLVLLLPALGQAAHRRRRQARRLRPEQRRQSLGELAGRDALQVEPRQQLLEVPGPAQIRRQDRRGEADRLFTGDAAVAHLGPADLERADARLDLPLGRVPVAHQASPALPVGEFGMGGEERLDLGLDRLHQHPPGALAQDGQQRIADDTRSWSGQADNAILLHGVSFRVTSTITEDTPPTSATKFRYSPRGAVA